MTTSKQSILLVHAIALTLLLLLAMSWQNQPQPDLMDTHSPVKGMLQRQAMGA
ncbi:MAG: hypothetical protein WCD18_13420 [Thermosynechococcaceae cyanobacterium]